MTPKSHKAQGKKRGIKRDRVAFKATGKDGARRPDLREDIRAFLKRQRATPS